MNYMDMDEIKELLERFEPTEDDYEELDVMSKEDVLKVWYLCDEHSYCVSDAINGPLNDITFYGDISTIDLAKQEVDEGLIFNDLDEEVKRFLDYDEIASVYISSADGYSETDNGMFRYLWEISTHIK